MSRRLTAKVCHYYYREQLTMAEIGARLGLSRHKVGRLLKEALDDGTVRIEIRSAYVQGHALERRVEEALGLQTAIVVEVDGTTSLEQVRAQTCAAGAEFVSGLMASAPTVGIGWGSTTYELVRQFSVLSPTDATVVQITGGNKSLSSTFDCHEVTRLLASKLGVAPVLLHAPGIVDKPATKHLLMQESAVRDTFRYFDDIDIAIVGIGSIGPHTQSALIDSGYIAEDELAALKIAGAMGDVFSYFIDAAGALVRTDLYDRMVTIGIEQIRKIRCSIGVAVGAQKAAAVAAAVKGQFVNTLIVDSTLAHALLRQFDVPQPTGGGVAGSAVSGRQGSRSRRPPGVPTETISHAG